MFGQPAVLEASTLWWALVVGLVVQWVVIYTAVRVALFYHREMVQGQETAARKAEARSDTL